jgi:hypothetical protein
MNEYCTVIAENATKHIDDNKTRNIPHSRIFQVSSKTCMYLHEETEILELKKVVPMKQM